MSRRLSDKGRDSRVRILEAAVQVAAERGYDGTTINLITERTGLLASSVYWHFQDKDSLLEEAIQHGYEQWRTATPSDSVGVGKSFEDAVRDRFKVSAQSLLERPEFWQMGVLLSLQRRSTTPSALARFRAIHAELADQLRSWYAAMLPTAVADPDLVDDLVDFHLTSVSGLYVAAASGQTRDLPVLMEHIAHAIIAIVQQRTPVGDSQ